MQPIVLTNAFLRPRATRTSSKVLLSENTNVYACVEELVDVIRCEFDATPLLLPTSFDEESLSGILARVDGIFLPGAVSNLHPSSYGRTPIATPQVFDTAHDTTDFFLVRKAHELQIPFFGICRAMQAMNVAFGGTLTQELDPDRSIDHKCSNPCEGHDDSEKYMHRALIEQGGMLSELFSNKEIWINSMHEQAIDTLGRGIKVEALSPDGVIEAISYSQNDVFFLGVQWHPEALPKHCVSQALFSGFRKAVMSRFDARQKYK